MSSFGLAFIKGKNSRRLEQQPILYQKLKLSVHFIIYILLIITFYNSFIRFLIK